MNNNNNKNNNNKSNIVEYLKEFPNYLTVFITPIFFMILSPIFIEISNETKISPENLNIIITFFTLGLILGQLTSVFYNKKFKKITVIISGYVFEIIFLIGISLSRQLLLFYILYFLLGYIAGVLWLQATQYILESKIDNKDGLTTIFLSFYPIGNFTAPLLVSIIVKNGIYWRFIYYVIIGIVIVIVILYLILKLQKRPAFKILSSILPSKNTLNSSSFSTDLSSSALSSSNLSSANALNTDDNNENSVSFKNTFIDKKTNIVFILGCLMLFFYCISETIMSTWSPTFLRIVKLFEINNAGLSVSIFWIAILLGRIIVSFIVNKFKINYILLSLSIIALFSISILPLLNNTIALFASIFFAGLGCSGIITLGISRTSTVYEHNRGFLASIVFAAVNIGASTAPFIIKIISRYSYYYSMVVGALSMLITSIFIIVKIVYEKN